MVYMSYLVLVLVSGDRDQRYQVGPTQWVKHKDGHEIQSRNIVLNKNRMTYCPETK
jgi:hypothetical protein